MKLKAVYPILYRSKQYNAGAELPADDYSMVAAWLEAGTAKWEEDNIETAITAKPATAQAGITGIALGSESGEDNLAGVVPTTPARTRKKN